MTTDDVLALARWPPCPVDLPESIRTEPWHHIIDVPRFIAMHITRLDSQSALLRRLAEKNLKALHHTLTTHSTPLPSGEG